MDKSIRLTNYIIDLIIISLIAIALDMLLMILDVYVTSVYLVLFMYYFILETYSGQTIGKRFTKTKVVSRDGSKPSIFKILMRTLLRLVPVDPMSYCFGFEDGFHDKVSSTRLIKK